jgi:hypothetical protein
VRDAVEHDRAAHDARIRTEVIVPHAVAEYDDARAAGRLLIIGEAATLGRRNAEDAREVRRCHRADDFCRLTSTGQRHAVAPKARERCEGTAVRGAQLEERAIAHHSRPTARHRLGQMREKHELFWVVERQWPQENAVDDREHRRRRADSERERQRRNDGERRRSRKPRHA